MRNKKIYLAGPMQYVPDNGTVWRKEIEKALIHNGFDVFNPANELKIFEELKESIELQNDIEGLSKQFKEIVDVDLAEVISSDLVLCNWTDGVFSSGTSGELTVARLFNIPVLLITGDIKKIPKWILGCIDNHQSSFTGLVDNIKQILK